MILLTFQDDFSPFFWGGRGGVGYSKVCDQSTQIWKHSFGSYAFTGRIF